MFKKNKFKLFEYLFFNVNKVRFKIILGQIFKETR